MAVKSERRRPAVRVSDLRISGGVFYGSQLFTGVVPFILFDPNAVKHVAGPVDIPIFGANDID